MANVIAKTNANDGMAITLLTATFKKNSTFDPSAEYVVMQDKKVLGLAKQGAELNDRCFPGLKYSGFLSGKVEAGIWCVQKVVPLGKVRVENKYPFTSEEKTEVIASFSATLKVIDPMLVLKSLIEGTTNLNYSVSALKNLLLEHADVVFSALVRKFNEKSGKVHDSLKFHYLIPESSTQASLFKTFSSVMNTQFNKLGYSLEISLSSLY